MPKDAGAVAEVFGYLTILGLLTWLIRRVFTHTLPRLANDFRSSLAKQGDDFREITREQQTLFQQVLQQQRSDFQDSLRDMRTDFRETLVQERALRERLCERGVVS